MLPRIQQATPLSGHRLLLKFNNQEERIFDCTDYLEIGVFKKLKTESYFKQVKVSEGTACWPEGQDFCPDMLYIESTPITVASKYEL
jgi:hypothetical protein